MIITAYCDQSYSIDYIRNFNMISNQIGALYTEKIKKRKFKIPHLGRIGIEFERDKQRIIIGNYSKTDPVCLLLFPFNYVYFDSCNEYEKKRYINDKIFSALKEFANEKKIDYKLFELIKIENENGKFGVCFLHAEIKDKKNGERAIVQVEIIESMALISIIIFDKKGGKVSQIELYRSLGHEYFYNKLLGEFKWDEDLLFLYSKTKEIIFCIESKTRKVEIKFNLKKRSEQELIDELKIIDYYTTNDERQAIINRMLPPDKQ